MHDDPAPPPDAPQRRPAGGAGRRAGSAGQPALPAPAAEEPGGQQHAEQHPLLKVDDWFVARPGGPRGGR